MRRSSRSCQPPSPPTTPAPPCTSPPVPGRSRAEELAAITGGEESPYSPYGVLLTEGGDPGDLAPVREGLAVVQDEGSQLVALLATRAPVGRGGHPLARPVRRAPGARP